MLSTVKFNSAKVTNAVKADLRANIDKLPEFDGSHFELIYDSALASIQAGRKLSILYQAIIKLAVPSMTKIRAGEIAEFLNNQATAIMEQEQQLALGITHAFWCYSSAPCMAHPKNPSEEEIKQDKAHKAADGKRYEVATGMYLDNSWTLPGRGWGCKCYSRSVIPGLA
ncbi:hypothetical protein [Acidocella sp.]|uniref:hypothetical protein n=1 Tax=Acidocella sp. TaxID=50710 RepID=UPI0017DAEAB9|nr:hypothetical protein [Acidocella sp.]NNM57900.1 hypothetical protein [Acidocella sp.]